jgi:uncharacterized protein (TIGR00369 family)
VTLSAAQIKLRSQRALEVPLLGFLGAALVDEKGAPPSLSMIFSERGANAVGAIHGGTLSTLLDVAAYLAVLPHLEEGEEALTHAIAANYMASASLDDTVRASGALLRRTRRMAFMAAELRSETGLLASAMVTKSVRSS